MDSASLYPGESIITKDAMEDRQKKTKTVREKEIQPYQRQTVKPQRRGEAVIVL